METRLLPFLSAWLLFVGCISSAMAAGGGAAQFLKEKDAWFQSAEAKRVAANILSYQSLSGGWPKNTNTVDKPFQGNPKQLKATFDNRATTDELRFLARCCQATKEEIYQAAFSKGLAYVLTAQYPSGGWPQFYPPGKGYHRHITFNDGSMTRLLVFLREVCSSRIYQFVPAKEREAARVAFDKGIDCILKCQIVVDGRPTVWCAQHDEVDYRPRPARTFELAGFSGSESVDIVRLLMSLERKPEIVKAVDGAVAWLEAAKLTGIRLETRPDPALPRGGDLVVVSDPSAPPLWARFYDLKTGKPFFVDRDGIPKASIAEIGYERRNGYAWYGVWPRELLEKEYPAWKRK